MKLLPSKKNMKRAKRIIAFGIGAGLMAPAGGAWITQLGLAQIDAVVSSIFGALTVMSSLVAALFITYAGKGEVADPEFDSLINESIENLRSKSQNGPKE
jgi:hypothetical protein